MGVDVGGEQDRVAQVGGSPDLAFDVVLRFDAEAAVRVEAVGGARQIFQDLVGVFGRLGGEGQLGGGLAEFQVHLGLVLW